MVAESDVEDAVAMGATFGELMFSIDTSTGGLASPISLYTGGVGIAISETPRSAGGSIVPIVFAEKGFDDGSIEFLEYAGYEVYGWSEDVALGMASINAEKFAEMMGFDTMTIDMYAYDLDKEEGEVGASDFALFDVYIFGGSWEPTWEPTPEPV